MNNICNAVCNWSVRTQGFMTAASSFAAVGIGFFGGYKIADYFGMRDIQERAPIEATCVTVALAILSQLPLNCLESDYSRCHSYGVNALGCSTIVSGLVASTLGAISSQQYNENKKIKWAVIGTIAAVASSVLLSELFGNNLAMLGSGIVGYTVGLAGMDCETPPREHFAVH